MLRRRGELRTRLTWTLVAMTVITAALVALALWASDTFIEDAVVRDLIENELGVVLDTTAGRGEGPRLTPNLLYYEAAQAPPELKAYGPGYHGEIELEGRSFMLLVRDKANGERVYLAYDATPVEEREFALVGFTAAVMLLGLTISVFVARRIAQRLLRPLYALVHQLEALDPERRGQRLSIPYVESELTVFVDSMNQYMNRLDAHVERERAFAAAASHELRTPLAVIRGAAETLALGGASVPLARIDRAVRDAVQQLDALLALSRLREAPAQERVRMPEFLHQVADAHLADPAVRTTLAWTSAPAFELEVPPGALAIIFGNLLRNAIRAAGGGEVHVSVAHDQIEVRDHGAGIPEQELPQVFEPHFRGRDGGSGMGLYIARVLAERFGWRLTIANHPQGGAVARLHLTTAPRRDA